MATNSFPQTHPSGSAHSLDLLEKERLQQLENWSKDFFLEYVRVDTASNPKNHNSPSSPGQMVLAEIVEREMRQMGVQNVFLSQEGLLYGELPGTNEEMKKCTPIGFLAHFDTHYDISGLNVKPQIHNNYDGKNLVINKELNVILDTKEFPEILPFKGDDIITASGDTLLGADDKAGIAIIMAVLKYFSTHPEVPHRPIKIVFTPDEEISRGIRYLDVDRFGATYAFTLDGYKLGEAEIETFNAEEVSIKIQGRDTHAGSAKNKMVNALRILCNLISSWPEYLTPEHTEGYEGFIHFLSIEGNAGNAQSQAILRDHNVDKFNEMKNLFIQFVELQKSKHPHAIIIYQFKEQYRNMKEIIDLHPELLLRLKKAFKRAGVPLRLNPVRGGTDGSALSFMGIPTPNIFIGGDGFHSKLEWISIQAMAKSAEVVYYLSIDKDEPN